MPNWCENHLKVSGKPEDMKKFLEVGIKKEKDEDVWRMSNHFLIPEDLNNTVSPAPKGDEPYLYNNWEIQDAKQKIANGEKDVVVPEPIYAKNSTKAQREVLMAKYGVDNWYDWTTNNWGTKWDCDSRDCGFTQTETEFNVTFSSAWCPPDNWLVKVSKDNPALKFELTYMETGCWFAGKMIVKKGRITQDLKCEPVNQTEDGKEVEENDDPETNELFEFRLIETGELVGWDDITTINPFEES